MARKWNDDKLSEGRDLAFDTDRPLNSLDDERYRHRTSASDETHLERQYGEARRHGDPYGEVFSRSLHDQSPPRAMKSRPLGERRHGDGRGNPRASGGYGSDRGTVGYGLSSAEGGFDEDEFPFEARGSFDPHPEPGAYGGQKGGLSGGYGRHESGVRHESAAVAGAFGGRREARLDGRAPDMRGRGPKGYSRSDERIREDVCEIFTDDPLLDAGDIEVNVADREVTLTGTVAGHAAKRHAEDLVELVGGVRHVQNKLRFHDAGSGAT